MTQKLSITATKKTIAVACELSPSKLFRFVYAFHKKVVDFRYLFIVNSVQVIHVIPQYRLWFYSYLLWWHIRTTFLNYLNMVYQNYKTYYYYCYLFGFYGRQCRRFSTNHNTYTLKFLKYIVFYVEAQNKNVLIEKCRLKRAYSL